MAGAGDTGLPALLAVLQPGHTVLVPSVQIASLLIDRVSRHHLDSGREVWATPAIRDFSSWVREAYEQQFLGQGNAPRVLEEVEERLIWRELVAASKAVREIGDAGAAARAAQTAYRALQDYGIAPATLRDFPGAETAALLRWSAEFEARCRELHALPGYCLSSRLLPVEPRPVPLESPAWRPATLRWLESHAQAPLAPERRNVAAEIRGRLYPQAESELVDCAEWLRAQRAARSDFRALVIVPDLAARRARVADVFDAALAPGRFSLREYRETPVYAIAGGVPLVGFTPVRLALEATQARFGACSLARFSALLRDPALQGGIADADAAARIDRELRRRCAHEAPLSGWLQQCGDLAGKLGSAEPCAVGRLRALHEALSRQVGRAPMSHWARVLITAWEAGPWMNRAHWSSAAYQAVQRLRELLHELARASGTFGARDLADALRIVAAAARDTAFQPATGVTPLWITSQLIDPWLGFDAIWVAGAAAPQWPPASQPVPLLPVQLQRRHGIAAASAAGQWRQAADLAARLRARASTLMFSGVSEGEADMAGALPEGALLEPAGDTGAEPHWERQGRDAPPLQELADAAGPAWDSTLAIRGVGILRNQSLCPFRGFVASRLAAEPLELPEPGFSASERGTIVHAALERLWRELKDSQGLAQILEQDLLACIESAAAHAVSSAAQRRDPGAEWRRREERRLLRLLPRWFELERRRPAFTVESMECGRRVSLAGLNVDVCIDRIDRLADGRLVLLDYKTGQVGKDWTGERPANPQLPVYALCAQGPLAAVAYAQIRGSDCRFRGVASEPAVLPLVTAAQLEADDFDAQLASWRERLIRIAEELRDGVARIAPLERACEFCALAGLCRIDPNTLAPAAEDAPGGSE